MPDRPPLRSLLWQRPDADHHGGGRLPRCVPPYLTRLLKSGKLPYRKKGNRDLVPVAALHAFKTEREGKLEELTALAAAEEDLGVR